MLLHNLGLTGPLFLWIKDGAALPRPLHFCVVQPEEKAFLTNPLSWVCLAQCGLYTALNGLCCNIAIAYTTIPQAVLFCNLHPLLIIVLRLLALRPVSPGELMGVGLAMVGMAGVVFGGMADTKAISRGDMLYGDGMGLVASYAVCSLVASPSPSPSPSLWSSSHLSPLFPHILPTPSTTPSPHASVLALCSRTASPSSTSTPAPTQHQRQNQHQY